VHMSAVYSTKIMSEKSSYN